MSFRVIRADSRKLPLASESVDLIITSPPYHGLRGYEEDGKQYQGQVGAEATLDEFSEALWAITAECWRVLKPTGSLFVNLGDRYDKHGQKTANGSGRGSVRTKSLTGAPWRYALGCIDDNGRAGGQWISRAEIIWHRTNAVPESATDRVMRRHEQMFHLTKQERYYASTDALREVRGDGTLGSLPGSIWNIPSQALRDVPEHLPHHTATFPTELVRRIVLGWSPAGICRACGEPWRVETTRVFTGQHNVAQARRQKQRSGARAGGAKSTLGRTNQIARGVSGYACTCGPVPVGTAHARAVVLDPFGGSGTTALVAHALGRRGISIDLSEDYCKLARWRLHDKNAIQAIREKGTELGDAGRLPVRMAFPATT